MTSCDLMEEIARLKEDRDRLIDEAKDLMRERDELHDMVMNAWRVHAEELKAEAMRFRNELDKAREGDKFLQKLLNEAIQQRDQARTCAEEMRDLYAAEIDESIAAFPFPWEDEHGADCDGQ